MGGKAEVWWCGCRLDVLDTLWTQRVSMNEVYSKSLVACAEGSSRSRGSHHDLIVTHVPVAMDPRRGGDPKV